MQGVMTLEGPPASNKNRVRKFIEQSDGDRRKAQEQYALFQTAKENHAEYVTRAKKLDDFYLGDQWDPKDKAKLDAQGRPALTINQCMPIINTVLGEQVSRRADVRFKPKKDATIDDAAMMGKVYQSIMDDNNYDYVESQVFADGIIQERGYFDIRVEFDENLFGHVVIKAEDPCDVIIDKYAKEYDPDTWSEIFVSRWVSLDYIEENYGVDKRELLESMIGQGEYRGIDSVRFEAGDSQNEFGNRNGGVGFDWFSLTTTHEGEKRRVRVVRVIERQFKQLHWQNYFVDAYTGDKSVIPEHWEPERIQAVAQRMGLLFHKVRKPRIRWRVSADNVLLHDSWSPYQSFTIVPFFPYFRRGKTAGVMTNLVSPQEMLNKIASQVTHVVNTTANSGWIVEEGSLANMTVADLEKKGAQTGLVIETRPNRTPPEKIQPNQIPTGLERISQNAQFNMKAISGVNDGLLGMESAEISGIALESKEQRGQIQLQVPMDHLAQTRNMVTRKVLECIQSYMTEPRILVITNERPLPGQPETEELAINQRTAEGIMNDVTRGKYSWVIASQPSRDSYNDSQFAEAMAMRSRGIAIPDHRVVQYSNLEHKMEIAEEVRQATGFRQPSEEEIAMQQLLQEIAVKREMLDLDEREAKILKLRAEAEYQLAKSGEVSQKLQLQIEDMEKELAIAREGFALRLKLADKQSLGKLESQVVDHRSKQTQLFTQAQLQQRFGSNNRNER